MGKKRKNPDTGTHTNRKNKERKLGASEHTDWQRNSVRLLIKYNHVNTAFGEDGVTPLLAAAGYGYMTVVTLLLNAKANIETRDIYGHTPLLCAIHHGHIDVVSTLIERKADINVVNNSNRGIWDVMDGNTDLDDTDRDNMLNVLQDAHCR